MGDDAYQLSDAAKKEIQDAIRIVREDRFERYVREHLTKGGTSGGNQTEPEAVPDPSKTEPSKTEPAKKTTPPPARAPETPPPATGEVPQTKRVGLWGNYAEN